MQDRQTLIGLPEESFKFTVPRKGLITKTEIRVLSLSKLDLRPGQVLWDIGAGSGSVGIEAARLIPDLMVCSIEKDEEDFRCLLENIEVFRLASRMKPVYGKAPEVLSELPGPDRVFIGGSGGKMADLLDTCYGEGTTHPKIVCNLATIENLSEVMVWAKSRKIEPDIIHVQIGRGAPIVGLHRIEALNPVWIVALGNPLSEREVA
ncbi:MAG: precorrin-6Y C5,15-methyltransferase (decarboxylating) subunit CbiT [Nitrospirota bacterium]|nr:precorrin-6Y C5,15-methyltransferase (decarboxylating) subunit CbiT [Nitrospirota bacterium]